MRQSEVLSLMRENVAYKLQHGKAKEAVDMLEKLHKYVKSPVLYTEEGCSCMNYSGYLLSAIVRHFQLFYLKLLTMLWRGGAVASWLVRMLPDQALGVRALAGDIVLWCLSPPRRINCG